LGIKGVLAVQTLMGEREKGRKGERERGRIGDLGNYRFDSV
jgi:hypothetical protein